MQKDGARDQRSVTWEDVGAAMESKAKQQGVKPQETNEAKGRDEEITGKALFLMLQRMDYRCALSGVVLDPDESSLDHIKPLSRGGEHVMENVVFVHSTINRMKGEMTADEFIGWCRKVAQWTS